MGYGDKVPMQMPSLCARCGEKPPTETFSTESKYRPLFTRITYTMHYSVPVCTDCDAKLKNRQRTGKIIMFIGIAILIVGLIGLIPYIIEQSKTASITTQEQALAYTNNLGAYAPFGITAIAGLLIGMFGPWFGKRSFAKWNGKLFQFYNKAFHAAFANLNPSISRKV